MKHNLEEIRSLIRKAQNGTISRCNLESLNLEYLYKDMNMPSHYDPSGNELPEWIGMSQCAYPSEHRENCQEIILDALIDLENEAIHEDRIKNRDTREIDHSFFVNRTFKKADE